MPDSITEEIAYDELEQPFDAHDVEALEKASKSELRLKEKKLRVVESIMSHEDGRAWMFDVLGTNCHVFTENPMRDTPERNGLFEGERAVGLRLLDEVMKAAPELFWVMRCEAVDRTRK